MSVEPLSFINRRYQMNESKHKKERNEKKKNRRVKLKKRWFKKIQTTEKKVNMKFKPKKVPIIREKRQND